MADDFPTHGTGDAVFDGEDRDALTTNSGEPVPDDQNSKSAGGYGTVTAANDETSGVAR